MLGTMWDTLGTTWDILGTYGTYIEREREREREYVLSLRRGLAIANKRNITGQYYIIYG